MSNKFGMFLAGGLVGAAIALLYAPRSGDETRAIVSDKVNNVWGDAQELGTKTAEQAQQFYHDAASKSQAVYEGAAARVQEAGDKVKPVFSEKSDDLREKIEAARQRIASQVAKNATDARDAADQEIPVAAENAAAVVDDVAQVATEAVGKVENAAQTTEDKLSSAIEDATKAVEANPSINTDEASK